MADVIGPCSTLPGAHHTMPAGAVCDRHPTVPAVARIQGETDSMGAELLDVCQECLDAIRAGIAEDRIGECDWCGKHATDLRPRRDFEEGMSGPVYQVCGACVTKELQRLADERDEWDDY